MSDSTSYEDPWLQRFRREVLDRGNVHETGGAYYRAGEILVHAGLHDELARELDRHDAVPHHKRNDEFARYDVPVRSFRLAAERSHLVPDVVRDLLSTDTTRALAVSANHVFLGQPHLHGFGGGAPIAAAAFAEPEPAPEGRTTLAVLDTGLPRDIGSWHPNLARSVEREGTDALDVDHNGVLDLQAGHGTFIAGVVRRTAPSVRTRMVSVLSPSGVCDEAYLSRVLARVPEPVINLSLGGFTVDDKPPVALNAAVQAAAVTKVIVAAAGNAGEQRPFWPAAFANVVAVAAIDLYGDKQRASFSNYGPWVDAAASGVDVQSTYVVGRYGLSPDEAEQLSGYAIWSGTSFAAPVVAALIAERVSFGISPAAAWQAVRESYPITQDGLGTVIVPSTSALVSAGLVGREITLPGQPTQTLG